MEPVFLYKDYFASFNNVQAAAERNTWNLYFTHALLGTTWGMYVYKDYFASFNNVQAAAERNTWNLYFTHALLGTTWGMYKDCPGPGH
jgi:hypothetical protein